MPDSIISPLTELATRYGVLALLVFWYACPVRHPARPRWRAFLMPLAVLAVVPPAVLAGLHYYLTRDGSPFMIVPVILSLPFALRAIIRGWLRSPPAVPRAVGSVTVRAGCVTRRADAGDRPSA